MAKHVEILSPSIALLFVLSEPCSEITTQPQMLTKYRWVGYKKRATFDSDQSSISETIKEVGL